MLPAEQSSPFLYRSSIPFFSRIAERRPPIARIVTPEAPVNTVKNAHIITVAIIMPAGIQPKNALKVRISLSPALLSDRIKPVRVNRGMAGTVLPISMV